MSGDHFSGSYKPIFKVTRQPTGYVSSRKSVPPKDWSITVPGRVITRKGAQLILSTLLELNCRMYGRPAEDVIAAMSETLNVSPNAFKEYIFNEVTIPKSVGMKIARLTSEGWREWKDACRA